MEPAHLLDGPDLICCKSCCSLPCAERRTSERRTSERRTVERRSEERQRPARRPVGGVAVGKAVYAAIHYIDRHLLRFKMFSSSPGTGV